MATLANEGDTSEKSVMTKAELHEAIDVHGHFEIEGLDDQIYFITRHPAGDGTEIKARHPIDLKTGRVSSILGDLDGRELKPDVLQLLREEVAWKP